MENKLKDFCSLIRVIFYYHYYFIGLEHKNTFSTILDVSTEVTQNKSTINSVQFPYTDFFLLFIKHRMTGSLRFFFF